MCVATWIWPWAAARVAHYSLFLEYDRMAHANCAWCVATMLQGLAKDLLWSELKKCRKLESEIWKWNSIKFLDISPWNFQGFQKGWNSITLVLRLIPQDINPRDKRYCKVNYFTFSNMSWDCLDSCRMKVETRYQRSFMAFSTYLRNKHAAVLLRH